MLDPHLGGDKEFFAGYARFFYGVSHLLFVEVGLRRVDMAVADFERVRNAPFALFPRHLIHAVAELGIFTPLESVTYSIMINLPLIYGYIIPQRFSKGNSKKVHRVNC